MPEYKWPKCSYCGDTDFSFKASEKFTVELHSEDVMTITTQCRKCGEYTNALLSYDVIEIIKEV